MASRFGSMISNAALAASRAGAGGSLAGGAAARGVVAARLAVGRWPAGVRGLASGSAGGGLGKDEWEWDTSRDKRGRPGMGVAGAAVSAEGLEGADGPSSGGGDAAGGASGRPTAGGAGAGGGGGGRDARIPEMRSVEVERDGGRVDLVTDPASVASALDSFFAGTLERDPLSGQQDRAAEDARYAGVDKHDVREPPERVVGTAGDWNDPIDFVKPERIGAGAPPLSTPEEKQFYNRMLRDKRLQRKAGFDPSDSEDWPDAEKRPRNMPLWMFYEAARSELESEVELEQPGSKKKMEQTLIRYPMRDEHGRAAAVGRRKTSVAKVWVKLGDGAFKVNNKPLAEYFCHEEDRKVVLTPLLVLRACGAFDIECNTHGGGLSGQAGAVKLGLARALARFDPYLRPQLKKLKLLTRDPRMVERKKPGQKKARKRFQWVKR